VNANRGFDTISAADYNDRGMIIATRITRLLLALAALSYGVSAQTGRSPLPAPSGHINDFAAVLDKDTVVELETILRNFDARTGAQIAVVTVKTLDGRPIEEYANELYRAWGIGAKTGENKDKGALLLIATEDRRSRLEVGYGLEGDLPDGLAGEMLRRMRPAFRELKWSEGVTLGVRTLVDTLARKWDVSLEGIDDRYAWSGESEENDEGVAALGVALTLFFLILILRSFLREFRSRGRRGAKRSGRGVWHSSTFNQSSGWSSSSWSSGGRDWGGFGGGSSGGGGASDSW
jgi:uncharacterized protein